MAFEKVLDLNADTTRKLEAKGDKETGYYLGFKTNKSNFGVSRLHIFNTAKGNVGIWGSAMLDEKLERVPAGALTQVSFIKKDVIKGGRTLKVYDVLVDRSQMIDVSSVSANTAAADSIDDADYTAEATETAPYGAEDAAYDEADDSLTAAPTTRGKPANFGKEHAKAVNNLLNKR